MKTFLHYTNEKELEEGFVGDITREGAKRTVSAVGNVAGRVAGAVPGMLRTATAVGRGAAAAGLSMISGDKLGVSAEKGVAGYKAQRAYQDKKLTDKTELSGAVVGCAGELAGIRLKNNREKISIQNSITAIKKKMRGTTGADLKGHQDSLKIHAGRLSHISSGVDAAAKAAECKSTNSARNLDNLKRKQGENLAAQANQIRKGGV